MRPLFIAFVSLLISSCGDSTITSEYDTVKVKKIIVQGEDGNDYELRVDKNGVVNTQRVQ